VAFFGPIAPPLLFEPPSGSVFSFLEDAKHLCRIRTALVEISWRHYDIYTSLLEQSYDNPAEQFRSQKAALCL
jgi:hypothetical protein